MGRKWLGDVFDNGKLYPGCIGIFVRKLVFECIDLSVGLSYTIFRRAILFWNYVSEFLLRVFRIDVR